MILNAIEKHLYTIIILHGMFQTNKSLFSTANAIQNYNKNIKIILQMHQRELFLGIMSEKIM